MNPFKQKEISLFSGYYFDMKKKIIVYLDVDNESEYFGNKTIYSRESNSRSSLQMMLSGNYSPTNTNDLCSLEVLEDMKLNKSLVQDFNWICKDENVKEDFVNFLINNEFYNLLNLFHKYQNPVKEEEKKKVDNKYIEDCFPKYKK